MKLLNRVPAIALIGLMACNNATETTTTTGTVTDTSTTVTTEQPAVSAKECYASITAKDTVQLTLMQQEGANITGELSFKYSGKDKNTGTLNGHMMGDTLMADYTFMSEGTSSVRQVLFLKTPQGYKEGYGESEEKGGKMVFKNYAKADYNKSALLEKVDCK